MRSSDDEIFMELSRNLHKNGVYVYIAAINSILLGCKSGVYYEIICLMSNILWVRGKIVRDYIRFSLNITCIDSTITERRILWLGHVLRCPSPETHISLVAKHWLLILSTMASDHAVWKHLTFIAGRASLTSNGLLEEKNRTVGRANRS